MTVYRATDRPAFRYDFEFKGRRYSGSTGERTRRAAEEWETDYRRKLRRQAAGLEAAGPEDTPRFSDWAKVTYEYKKKREKLKRPEQLETTLRMVLEFWGPRPAKNPTPDAPYRDLHLGHPIAEPELIEEFETWMDGLGISGSRKNHYRSACSVMYKVALLPAYRKRSGVKENPFAHIVRDRVPKRITTYTAPELRAIIGRAAWHIRIALAIGALAPKLRLRNVLNLRWDTHVRPDLSMITDPDHKTDRETGLPLIVFVSSELKAVLEAARRGRKGAYVVHYRGKRIADIKTGLKHAVTASGLTWGRAGGVTYHSLRHTMATELVRMRVDPALRQRLMGHADPQTTAIYTHMVPLDEIEPLEALGQRHPVADLVEPPESRRKSRRSSRFQSRRSGAAHAKTTR